MGFSLTLRLSALIAGVLFAAGYCIVILIPGGGDVSADDFTDFYGSDGKIFASFVLVLVLLAGCLALVWFFTELKTRLGDDMLTRVGYVVSMIGAGAVAVGGAILSAPGGVQQNSDAEFVGVAIAHTLAQAGLLVMLVVGMYSLALGTALFSLSARRAALMPPWLSITGVVVAIVMLGSYIWAPGFIFPVWVVVIGLVGVRRRAGA